ncbi:MAG TPA: MarC family protein [Ktedonobacterales bacterium]|nr:MarC family protein [Ktedonobacterales bacterium]
MVLFFIKALVALFTVVDPIGLAPVTLVLTADLSAYERAFVVTRATIIAAVVVAIFGVLGEAIFSALGVTPPAFSLAGGALLFLVAIDMLFGRQSGARETAREAREARKREDISVFPLAIPMIAGPGTLTTLILLNSSTANNPAGPELLLRVVIGMAAALTLIACWITMRLSLTIQKRIGVTGILVLSRVQGMLLAAVAAQFMLNGLAQFLHLG